MSRDEAARRRWMSVLAQASVDEVQAAWESLPERPAYRLLRAPETGLVMVRGRAGGTGVRFNLGEMPVTRCSVELTDGSVGHAYVGGRSRAHAEMAAVLDAMLQDGARQEAIERTVIGPMLARSLARRRTMEERSAGTRVEFFTMVRGEE
ncbi:MAG TPA: phosphonate C-P lyase system protein PhnG [Candidatus Bathyarchaeia archaeon]|nr:phosphonate C-P lyase system protein PhnG [Candidatus Bathyarchaeia archaeon]